MWRAGATLSSCGVQASHCVSSCGVRASHCISSCGVPASHCGGFSCCTAWASGHRRPAVVVPGSRAWAQRCWRTGLAASWPVGSCQTSDETCVPYTGTTWKVHCCCFQAPDTASPDAQTDEGWDDTHRLPCSDTESELGPASKAAALKWGQCLETSVVLTLGVGRVKSAPGKKWGRARGAANHPPRGVT